MRKKLYKPGQDNKPKGTYTEVGPKGGKVPKPRQATIDQGDRLPPTQKAGHKWKPL
ncbi:MAG: YjzC family protein [Aerococcus sp.]|nr:YjzC family protein [Aerococcus sp.]